MVACRVYIDAEEKGLRETLETLVREESWKPMEDAAQTNVLRSASELFAVIKKSLTRCARFVSRGEPMLHLMGAFQVDLFRQPLMKMQHTVTMDTQRTVVQWSLGNTCLLWMAKPPPNYLAGAIFLCRLLYDVPGCSHHGTNVCTVR